MFISARSRLRRVRSLIRNLAHRAAAERSLDDELRAYVDLATAEKIRAGLAPADARRAALLEVGGAEQVKEHVRDARAGARLESFARDVHHAVRALARAPGFTAALVATLAIGIGLNTAVVTLVYSALARPLPVRDAARIVNVYERRQGPFERRVRGNSSFLSYAEFQAYAAAQSFATSAVYFEIGLSVDGVTTGPVPSQLVSCDYFRTMAVPMALGRPFAPDECAEPGAGPVAVLDNASWRTRFGADSGVVGRVVRVNGVPLTVIGVAEPGFRGISFQPASLWVPVTMQPALEHGRDHILTNPNASWLVMTARLAPGATLEQARAEAAVIARRLDEGYPGRHTVSTVARGAYVNFPEVSTQGRTPILLVMLLGFTIVGLACANVTGLLLARGLARRREIAIRLSIGASRGQLVQQLLIESGLVALAGAVLGLALDCLLPLALRLSPIGELSVDIAPDLRIAGYALVLAGAAAVMAGLLPALQSTRVDLVSALKGSVAFGRHRVRPSRLRASVLGVQIGGSVLLLVMAALFVRGALRATSANPGYVTHNVVAFSLNAAALGYDAGRAAPVYRALTDRLGRVPGVEGVALASRLPLLSRNTETVALERDRGADVYSRTVNVATVSAGYFATMGIRIVRGTAFDTASAEMDGVRDAVISGSMAAAVWRGADPLGERFVAAKRSYRVVGIASEAASSSLARPTEPTAYLASASPLEMQIVVRTKESPAALIAQVPEWVRELDPTLTVRSERLEERIAAVLLPARLTAGATATLGALALVLAAIGVAGVVSFGLGQRRHEVAVRLAIGATSRQVVTLMMGQGTTPVVAGIVAGLCTSMVLGRLVRGLLFGVSPLDPLTYAAVAGVLVAVSALATYVPSRGAARVDPASVLRDEG